MPAAPSFAAKFFCARNPPQPVPAAPWFATIRAFPANATLPTHACGALICYYIIISCTRAPPNPCLRRPPSDWKTDARTDIHTWRSNYFNVIEDKQGWGRVKLNCFEARSALRVLKISRDEAESNWIASKPDQLCIKTLQIKNFILQMKMRTLIRYPINSKNRGDSLTKNKNLFD